jgi:hypothetical protein
MGMSGPARDHSQRARRRAAIGPEAAFWASVATAGVIIATGVLPTNLLMPVVTTLLFVLATVFALVAWVRCSTDEYGVTYWDVAGAVLLIGIGTSVLIEPEQLAGLIADSQTRN